MKQRKIPAVFMRGGTSKAIIFNRADLPEDRTHWDAIFLAAIGSPDPNRRQLNGMGGGISSLSKVCIVEPSDRDDADVNYTFAQISVDRENVGYGANCGNMSSAIGPFSVDEGLVEAAGDDALVRIYNTNTDRIIHSRFARDGDLAAVDGDFDLKGVAGTGAPVRLEFHQPGGAATGRLLPTGNVIDEIAVEGLGVVEASLVDSANPFVFVEAKALGLIGTEAPADIDARAQIMGWLENIRAQATVMMGIAKTVEDATENFPAAPWVGMVAPPQDAQTLAGEPIKADDGDLTARILSSGNTHRALPLTGALCCATGARIEGTVIHRHTRPKPEDADIQIMQPSGIIPVACTVTKSAEGWIAEQAGVYRTQRRLFEGRVLIPGS
jgi:2-methylaconitate cis-trans-isomerase PrpF